MRKNIFPSVKEALPVAVVTVLFLLLTAVCIGLRTEHLLMAGLFLVLFFAGKTTRKIGGGATSFYHLWHFLRLGCGYIPIMR